MTRSYKLEELAAEAGVSPRTVRYYVQRGLLPAPEFRGKDTVYGREHLLRLHAIKRLQQGHLPLDEIQVRLANATLAELARLARSEVDVSVRGPFEEPRDTGTDKKGGGPYRSSGREEGHRPSDHGRSPFEPRFEPRPLPLPLPYPADPTATAHVYRLATGVELWVRGGLPAASRALVREILDRYATVNDVCNDDEDERR